MTSLSENKQENEVNIDSKQCVMENKQSLLHTDDDLKSIRTLTQETTDDHPKQEEIEKNMQNNNSTSETEQKNLVNGINNDDALMNTSLPIVTSDREQQKEATEPTVNNDENENRSKKSWNPKVKYSPMPYHRFPYYPNGHAYGGPAPYYYYSLPSLEKPAPLMFISTQQPSSSRDSQTSNSTTVSPQNLPPRLRQTSTTEAESTSQISSTTSPNSQSTTTTTTAAPATNGRRHRSILPRGLGSYYSHPPPPLMATPPGVLYPYPPAVHPPGHIAYSIRPSDELEFYALQQQFMNLPQTSIIWPPTHAGLPPHGHPQFAPYAMNGLPPPYMFNNSVMTQPANSFLNPDAAEWVPTHNDNDIPSSSSSSSDNNILIDDEINFPPLNSTTNNTHTIPTPIKDHIEDNSEHIETTSETISTNDNTTNDNTPILTDNTNILTQSNIKIESSNISSSSQDDNNKSSSTSSSPIKVAPISYSTIISKTSENNKTKKNNTNNQSQVRQQQQQPLTNHAHNQLPPRDRFIKQQQQQQRIPTGSSSPSNFNSRQRQPLKNNRPMTRNLLPTEAISLSKQQQQQQPPPSSSPPIADDWIEVKSKKTKKFDRNFNDNSTEKFILDEQKHKSVSPPLSLTSTGDNTTATFTSEDDYDDKDNQDLVIIMNNDVSNDYNQIIIDDIHNRLDNNERLLIIMRGCPGSGKSTLAKSLNHGYNGVILSTDDYFIDRNLNRYVFDLNRLDDAHRYNRRRASDAFKRNISPIIIDNTNTQTWEMKPYVSMGKDAGYDILLIEPQTPWRYKPRELFKRNCHNLPMKRIREMLNRFEYNVTAQNIIDQLSTTTKSNNNILSSEQENVPKDNEITDPLMTSKKFYDIIDDSLILDDVRLCINDMILFLTSNFYQTTLLSSALTLPTTTTTTTTTSPISTPLSVSFHDLSLISPTSPSLPSTPSTPHSRFHRPLGRFPSTINQDHSFNSDHILRLPSTAFSRCIDTTNLTPPLSAQSSLIAKKRQKNKNKQQSNELVLNTNNNNNNNYIIDEEHILLQQQTFNVFLPEDCSDFIVIDEQDNNDWIDHDNRNINIQMNSLGDHSSTNPYKQNQLVNSKTNELLNIIHKELNKPSHHPSVSTKHIAIQCSSDDFNINPSDLILIGHHVSSSMNTIITSSIPPLPGYNECGIQVDLNDKNLDLLYEIYLNHLSNEIIEQFYEICHQDIEYTRTQIDEYLQYNNQTKVHIPTLQQLSLHTLNQWNEQIKSINPLFDTKSIDDLLQDINDDDDERLEDLTINNTSSNSNIEFNDLNHINIPWSILNSLEELYGEISNKTNNNSISLPIDNELSISIYQALQRHLIKSNQIMEPVIENKKKIDNTNNQKWKLPSSNNQFNSNVKTNNNIPSLKQIMKEEQQANKCQKSKQKHQLDYVTEHKLKELQRHFPSFDNDLLYDIFRENEYNYDITLVCISTMLDDNANIMTMQQPQSISSSRPISTIKPIVEPVLESYEILRQDALHHAQQRKELYTKAHQANGYGMCGVASFYIHRASEENQLMKNANRAACERLSQWRLTQFYKTQQLDLHGLHSDEALNLFKQIEQEYNEKNRKTTPKSIHIITGYGKNSIYGGGHGKIRSVILTYLKQRNYKYSEPNKGVILLQLTNAKN